MGKGLGGGGQERGWVCEGRLSSAGSSAENARKTPMASGVLHVTTSCCKDCLRSGVLGNSG